MSKVRNTVFVDTKAVSLECLSLVAIVGNIACTQLPHENASDDVLVQLKKLCRVLIRIADLLKFSIVQAFAVKMDKNETKCPPSRCTSEVKTIKDHTGASKASIKDSKN